MSPELAEFAATGVRIGCALVLAAMLAVRWS